MTSVRLLMSCMPLKRDINPCHWVDVPLFMRFNQHVEDFLYLCSPKPKTMKKLYIETYGCQMNVADSEVVASVMQMAGYEICDKEDEADAIFLNTCSVRENAENKIYNRLDSLHAERKKGRNLILGVLGCMAERVKDDLLNNHHTDLVCGPDSYLNLPDMIAQAETGNKAIDIELSLSLIHI